MCPGVSLQGATGKLAQQAQVMLKAKKSKPEAAKCPICGLAVRHTHTHTQTDRHTHAHTHVRAAVSDMDVNVSCTYTHTHIQRATLCSRSDAGQPRKRNVTASSCACMCLDASVLVPMCAGGRQHGQSTYSSAQ